MFYTVVPQTVFYITTWERICRLFYGCSIGIIVLKVRDNLFCKVQDINIVYWLLVF